MRQAKFADVVGLSRGYVSGLIAREKRPSLEIAMKIEQFTDGGVPCQSWFSESEIRAMRSDLDDTDAVDEAAA